MSIIAASGMLTTAHVSADQLTDLRAKAAALEARITQLGQQEDALSEQYDKATIAQQQTEAKVKTATAQVATANSHVSKAKSALRQEAVDAYTQGGTSGLGGATSKDQSLSSANESLLRAEYVQSLATNQSDAMDSYHLASLEAQTAKSQLQAAENSYQQQTQQLASAKSSVQGTQNQLQAAYQQDQGQIKTLVIQIQQQQEAAAAAAAARQAAANRAAAQQQAAAQAQAQQAQQNSAVSSAAPASSGSSPSGSSGGSSGGGSSAPPPPVGRGAAGAVAAALSRVGDPYVWGAAGPSSFDCSGLVMWSYAQAGISLPHYSGDQFADGTHISMSQLEPGDLVFPSDPGEHVAMYIGNGQIVQAPYTGADVQVVALSSFFVQAVRIA